MRLNLISDQGGRSFARALQRAYQMGYDDAKAQHKKGRPIYAQRNGIEIAKAIVSKALTGHKKFLRSAYSAGLWQCQREVGS